MSSLQPLLALFIASYIACAVFFQVNSTVPVWYEAAPIEFFTSSLLFMISLVCLFTSVKYEWFTKRFLFWVAGSAGLAILAMDERFAQHEKTAELVGDDDYFKILAWVGAGVVLFIVCRIERPKRLLMIMLGVGYFFHLMYLLMDIGDGDVFRIPSVERTVLRRLEEAFELLFLSTYLLAFGGFLPLTGPRSGRHEQLDIEPASRSSDAAKDLPQVGRAVRDRHGL